MKRNRMDFLAERKAFIIVNKCQPTKCQQECARKCPKNMQGYKCITFTEDKEKKAVISRDLCIGCGICPKKCPFDAIEMVNINIPKDVLDAPLHSYTHFSLYALNISLATKITGLIGMNGVGKSTLIKIISGELKPNYGGGKSNQNVNFARYLQSTRDVFVKCQDITKTAEMIADKKVREIIQEPELDHLNDRLIKNLSGGELQRVLLYQALESKCDLIAIDEFSNYLDVVQRIKMCERIKASESKLLVCDHDLMLMDLLCKGLYIIYGSRSHYGGISQFKNTGVGINEFIDGRLGSENLLIRDKVLKLNAKAEIIEREDPVLLFDYPEHKISYEKSFCLQIAKGSIYSKEVIYIVGENGTGKTSYLKWISNYFASNSYKPQELKATFEGTVDELLQKRIPVAYTNEQFVTKVMKPLEIYKLTNTLVKSLSGGELQRLAITLTMGKGADLYLFDEPSACLDCDFRIIVAKILKDFICETGKACIVIEHDLNMTMTADKIIYFSGKPGILTEASAAVEIKQGINTFMKNINTTIRLDKTHQRPRLNSIDSQKDKDQKKIGNYFESC